MDLFSLACTTCQQRLVVRDASAIGQILACPRCGSMVQIQPPEGWRAPTASAAPSPAPPPAPPPPASEPASHFEEAAEILDDTPSPSADPELENESLMHEPPMDEPPMDEPAMDEPASVLPNDAWTSPTSQRGRQLAMIGVGAIGGVVLATVVVGAVLSWLNPAVESALSPGERAEAAPTEKPIEKPTGAAGEESSSKPPAPAPQTVNHASGPQQTPDSPRKTDAKPARAATSSDKPQGEETPAEKTEEKTPPQPQQPDPKESARPVDPPGLVARPAEPAPSEQSPELREGLGKFSPLLEDDSFENRDPNTPKESPTLEIEQSLPRPEPRKVDLEARLADKLAALEMRDVALIDLVRFLTDFSTIPITIDVDELAWARQSADAKLSVQLSETTLQGLLEAVLPAARLEHVALDGQLLITRRTAHRDDLREITHAIDDLASTPEEIAQLQEWCVSLIAAGSWQPENEPGSIRAEKGGLFVKHHEFVQLQILHFLEKLRIARGAPPRSKFPPEMFALPSRTSEAQSLLGKQLTLNYSQPTKLTTILDRLRAETGGLFLVDWRSTLPLGWNPDTEAMLVADQTTLQAALWQMLRPMDLDFRVVNSHTIQIVAAPDLQSVNELEFYSLKDLTPRETGVKDFIASLQKRVLGDQAAQLQQVSAIHYDEKSNCLLVSLPQPLQQRLEELLR